MKDKSYYLTEGPLTKISPDLINLADSINGEGIDLLFNISNKINSEILSKFKFINDEKKLKEEYQRRTVDEIFKSSYFFGCSDTAHLFESISRYKGIPTKHIHTVDVLKFAQEKIISNKSSNISAHVYCECYLNNNVYLIDPSKNITIKIFAESDKKKLYKFEDAQLMVEAYSGLDERDCRINSFDEMMSKLRRYALNYIKSLEAN